MKVDYVTFIEIHFRVIRMRFGEEGGWGSEGIEGMFCFLRNVAQADPNVNHVTSWVVGPSWESQL